MQSLENPVGWEASLTKLADRQNRLKYCGTAGKPGGK